MHLSDSMTNCTEQENKNKSDTTGGKKTSSIHQSEGETCAPPLRSLTQVRSELYQMPALSSCFITGFCQGFELIAQHQSVSSPNKIALVRVTLLSRANSVV